MKLTRKFYALLICCIFATSVHAVDFGGSLENNTRLGSSTFDKWELAQQDSLTGWLKVPFNSDGKLYLATEGTLFLNVNVLDLSNSSSATTDFLFDIGLFKLGGVFNIGDNLLQLNLGRFFTTDVTGIIMTQTTDGIQGAFTSDYFKASLFAAYTGLTNAMFSPIIDGPTSTFVPDDSKVYCFNSPYIVTGATISAPYLFANQTVGLEFFGMFGTKGINGDNAGYNRSYLTLFMNGPIAKNLFYTLSSSLEFKDGIANLTSATLSYYPAFKSASISLNAVYASGESGSLKAFEAFSSNTATYAYNLPEYTGLLKFGLKGSIKPIENLYTSVGADIALDTGSESGFRGFQWDAAVKYQIFTDLQASLIAKQFYDSKDKANNSTSFALNVRLTF
ncbi:MAG: hypothetical protein J6W60_02845 [Treponema sp.]|nr:hypothetical protein [Treponema sp.]MBP5751784.1 hypothetical protein [Treponema sp.]